MRRARRIAAAVVLAAVGIVLTDASPAMACSCSSATDEGYLAGASVVFTGIAIDRQVLPSPPSPPAGAGPLKRPRLGAAIWTFQVDRVFKGQADIETRVVSTIQPEACGLDLPRSVPVIVYADVLPEPAREPQDDIALASNACGGTRSLGDRPVPASYGRGSTPGVPPLPGFADPPAVAAPVQPRSSWPVTAAIAAAAAVAGLVTGLALGRRRARPQGTPT